MQTTSNCAGKLNDLLKGEIAAVETYRQALEKVTDQSVRSELQNVHNCHACRVDSLREKVASLGETPADNSGIWGAFAKLLEGGAKLFGEKAAVSMLEEGEDKELADYRNLLEKDIDPELKMFVKDLLQKQENTHEKMRNLKHQLQ